MFEERANYCRYQSDSAVGEYCDAHYGPDKFGVENFPKALVAQIVARMEGWAKGTALDLGCAVGRSSFELARHFDQVVAIDYSAKFIEVAQRLQERGGASYRLIEEGEVLSDHKVNLSALGLTEFADKVSFRQADAQQLDKDLANFDLVLAANLIDRIPRPARFLSEIHTRVSVGGMLVIASPYDWQEAFTSRKNWLGGNYKAGTPRYAAKELEKYLGNHFTMCCPQLDLEFVIRRTARTYHHSISQVSFWRCHHNR